MKIEWNKKYTTIAVYVCIVLAFGALCAFAFFNLGTIWRTIKRVVAIFDPVIYGFVIAFILNPMFRLFERKAFAFVSRKKKRIKLQKVLALICTYLVAVMLISGFALIVVPQLETGVTELQSKMSGYIDSTQGWIEKTLEASRDKHSNNFIFKVINVEELSQNIRELLSNSYKLLSDAVPYITDFVTSMISVVKNVVMGIIISIYFLFSRDMLCAQVQKVNYAIFKKEHADRLVRVTRFTSHKFESFLSGKIIDSIIIGILTAIVLTIFKIPYPVLIATIIGVTNIIPFFGPFIGAIPSAFIIFVADPIKALWFIIIIIVIQQLDGNIIGPMILGDRIGISALWIVISLLVMGGLLGFPGLFIGVPIFAVLYAFFVSFIDRRLEKKGLPAATEQYFRSPDDEYHRMRFTPPKSFVAIKNLTLKIVGKIKEKSKSKKQK